FLLGLGSSQETHLSSDISLSTQQVGQLQVFAAGFFINHLSSCNVAVFDGKALLPLPLLMVAVLSQLSCLEFSSCFELELLFWLSSSFLLNKMAGGLKQNFAFEALPIDVVVGAGVENVTELDVVAEEVSETVGREEADERLGLDWVLN